MYSVSPAHDAEHTHVFKPFDTDKRKGAGMEVCAGAGPGIGLIYPLRTATDDLKESAMLVVRAKIEAQPVKVTPNKNIGEVRGYKRYTVELFGSSEPDRPAATIGVRPLLYPTVEALRPVEYLYHESLPVRDTLWAIPDFPDVIVTDEDIANVGENVVPFDESLVQAVEAGIRKMLTDQDHAVLFA